MTDGRAMDLVRYARHFLLDADLISTEEFAALVKDSESGMRVSRLEAYDCMRQNVADAEKRAETAEAKSAAFESRAIAAEQNVAFAVELLTELRDRIDAELKELNVWLKGGAK